MAAIWNVFKTHLDAIFHGEHDKIGPKSSFLSVFLAFRFQNRYFMPIFNDFEPVRVQKTAGNWALGP